MLAATGQLLTSLDPLPYPERLRRVAAWARAAADRAEVCAELRGFGPYESHLALIAAAVTGDEAGIEAALADPQPSVRAAALAAAVRRGLPIGTDRPAEERKRLYRLLRRIRTPAAATVAEALIGPVRAEFGDEEAAALLPACGAEVVRALLPALEHAVEPEPLMRRYPAVVLERAGQRLAAAAPAERDRLWAGLGCVLDGDPETVLTLLERFAPPSRLPGRLTAYGKLAAHRPERVIALLTAPGRAAWIARTPLPPALLRRLAALPADRLAPLGRRVRDHAASFAALLEAVPPARRGALYDGSLEGVHTATRVPSPAVMEVLPAAVRTREATRVLALPETRERESRIRLWSSFLPWPEASAALAAGLRSGDAEERAAAYRLLVHAARRSRDPRVVAELVEQLTRLRNEQDPVRSAALGALASVARLLTPAAAPALTRLTTDAVDARDGSAATMSALASLAADTLQHHVGEPGLRDWALLTIDLAASAAQTPVLRRFDTVLRRGQETMVAARLEGWVTAAMDRGWFGPLFALTGALGKRAWTVPALQELLHRATGRSSPEWVATRAVELWLENPRGRSDRVERLVMADPTTVTAGTVWRTLGTSRTDLLDRVLDRPPRGRFVPSHLRWVPGWPVCPERWLPRQHAAYLRLQERVAGDAAAGARSQAAAIRAAAPIPVLGRELVLRHVDSPVVVLAEAALGALVWTDRPGEALPLLLSRAGDDRARVALYAAGRAVRFVAPSAVPAVLLPVLLGGGAKVTSRKAVARLVARYGPPSAMGALLRAYAMPDAHRDVRAAIVAAARLRLDAAESWTVLATAVDGSREERRAVLAAAVSDVAERHRARYASLVVELCRVTDPEVRRAAFLALPYWSRWAGEITGLVVGHLTDLDGDAGPVDRLLGATNGGGLDRALELLVERDVAPAVPGDDLPARRRVATLAQGAATWACASAPDTDRSAVLEAGRRLASRPEYTGIAATMLVDAGRLGNLDEVAGLCAGRPLVAVRAAGRVAAQPRILDPELVRRLADRGDLAGGLFAVALVKHGASIGWASPWRELLLRLRGHPDPDVREEAYAVDMT